MPAFLLSDPMQHDHSLTLSTLLLVPKPPQSTQMSRDEQWVALTRNLTLVSAQYETAASGSGKENMMNLDHPLDFQPYLTHMGNTHSASGTVPTGTYPPYAAHTPPLYCSAPPHSHFSGASTDTPPLTRQGLQQPQQQIPAPTRCSRFTMGPPPDCDKYQLLHMSTLAVLQLPNSYQIHVMVGISDEIDV
ncbi:hypothetical protein BJV78DRAFT_1155799 [Lactifluus subvellereus]|nr:hypothetical protein BJV78DRAFT_1155799 [Lactifluus subvellereus]